MMQRTIFLLSIFTLSALPYQVFAAGIQETPQETRMQKAARWGKITGYGALGCLSTVPVIASIITTFSTDKTSLDIVTILSAIPAGTLLASKLFSKAYQLTKKQNPNEKKVSPQPSKLLAASSLIAGSALSYQSLTNNSDRSDLLMGVPFIGVALYEAKKIYDSYKKTSTSKPAQQPLA